MYKFFIRPILFLFDPEFIHRIVFSLLTITGKLPGFRALITWWLECKNACLERRLWGLRFKNPVGLAAGFDKNGKWIDTLQGFGFGFIEIGTITPRPQKGNPTPRLFRLPQDHALINRMGFNNLGAQAVADRLAQHQQARGEQRGLLIGGNIGKNKDTPNEQAISDYAFCFEVLYRYVDYFVVNVSSPNTPGLRALQNKGPLRELLTHIKKISDAKDTPKPILLKIAPDLSPEQLEDIVDIIKDTKIDGVVATNTTTSRDHMVSPPTKIKRAGEGGLSGQPLTQRATEVIRYLRQNLGVNFPIIGVGGIMSPQDALDKIHAGADLIQLYTGFLYEGPALIKRINKAIQQHSPTQP